MIYSYEDCIKKYGNHYQLEKALKDGDVFKIDNGIYSTDKHPKDLEIFVYRHNKAIFTMESALFYLGISDVVPNTYVVATDKDGTKYKDENIKQYFLNNSLLNIGVTTIKYNGVSILSYNKERMLIEVIRYKNKVSFDYYKEIIGYYRNHINEIDIQLVLEYLELFPKKSLIFNIIQLEVI